MQTPRNLRFQINKLWAKNFRSIADASIELDELIVLVGANASGKSNVLDILRFVKDAFRFDLEAAISMRHGINAIRRHDADGNPLDIEIGICATFGGPSTTNRDASIEYGFTLTSDSDEDYKVKREYSKVWQGGGDNCESVEFKIEDGEIAFQESLAPRSPNSRFGDYESSDSYTSDLWLRRIARAWLIRDGEADRSMRLMASTLERLHRRILSMRLYHIFPNTIREPQKLGNAYPLDEDAGNLASVLRDLAKARPSSMKRLKKSLGHLVPGVSDLEVASAGGYLVVRLKHDSAGCGAWFDLSQESDGTVRLLGLLAALYQRHPLSLIGIEEPELTVHPGALAVLADLLNEASQRSQVVITTHSPELIDHVTDYRHIEKLRIVTLLNGITDIYKVSNTQAKSVKQSLFSPGELHRMGELSEQSQ